MASAQGGADTGGAAGFFSALFGSGGSYVGLNIGASNVKVVQLKKRGKGWEFVSFGSSPIEGAVSEQREIVSPQTVVSAIKDACSKARVSSKDVCASVGGSGVIIKTITVTVGDIKELNDQVLWEAEQYIPFDINDVAIDFEVIRKITKEQFDVLVVAVKKDLLDQICSAVESAKLKLNVVDVESFALQNCFEANYNMPTDHSVLIADIGAMGMKTVICSDGHALFTKDSPYGGMMVTQEIQRELKLPSLMDAEALKTSGNLPQEVSEIIARNSHMLGSELKKSIDFYSASSVGPPVTVVYLSGGTARSPDIQETIREYVGVPVEFLNPFERIRGGSKTSSDFLESIAPEVAVPVGLAMRSRDRK
jgi:type IV pilus assembly protein PilM